ncbi:MAG: hypothetical protein E5V75_06675 [Mesorhizobium sp.]|nr:MAG: hypothetical protein E5V75_06675 [Mesorhizobium sp.]
MLYAIPDGKSLRTFPGIALFVRRNSGRKTATHFSWMLWSCPPHRRKWRALRQPSMKGLFSTASEPMNCRRTCFKKSAIRASALQGGTSVPPARGTAAPGPGHSPPGPALAARAGATSWPANALIKRLLQLRPARFLGRRGPFFSGRDCLSLHLN